MRERYFFVIGPNPKFFREFDENYRVKGEDVEIISLYGDDPRFSPLVRTYTKYKRRPDFFGYVRLEREYSEKELATARILRMMIKDAFEPSGEECGTRYDDTCACGKALDAGYDLTCGSGRRQTSNLVLDISKIPKADITMTIALGEEWVVSSKFKELVLENGIDGCEFKPVEDVKGREKFKNKWFQLIVKKEVEVSIPPSFFADDPFIKSNLYHCSRCGRLKGLRLWSELYLKPNQFTGDIAKTKELYGFRKGLLMPTPFIVISQKFYQVLKRGNIRGYSVEIAHVT